MGGVRSYAPSHFLSANTGISTRSLFRATAFIRKKNVNHGAYQP